MAGSPENKDATGTIYVTQLYRFRTPALMSVLFLTIFVSMMLALFFVGAFLYHHDFSGGDALRDSLLPFERERTRSVKSQPQPPKAPPGKRS